VKNVKSKSKARLWWRILGMTVIGGLMAAGGAASRPILSAKKELQSQLDGLESLSKASEATALKRATAAEEAAQWEAEESRRLDRAKSNLDEAGFLHWVNQQSQSTSLQIRDYRPSGRELVGDYQARSVLLSTQGSYTAICQFLDKLRGCPQMHRITSLEIAPQNSERTSFGATINVQLLTVNPDKNFTTLRGQNNG
jgi:Tfp pilus assembly protein PilO